MTASGHRPLGAEPRSVADRLAGADALHRDDAAGERHDRTQLDGRGERRRHHAVEQEAGAHEVVPDAGIAQQRRAVGGVAELRARAERVERRARRVERHALLIEQRVLGLVGGREVGVDAFELEVRAREQVRQRPRQVLVPEPEAMHAGVDLQVIADARVARARRRLQRPPGGRTRNRRRQVVLEDAGEIADAQRAEDQDPRARARLAQLDALLDVGDREPGRARLFERAGDANRPVPVGVGLDDGDDARRGRRPARRRPIERRLARQIRDDRLIVGARRIEIDVRGGAANHEAMITDATEPSVSSSQFPVQRAGCRKWHLRASLNW